MSRAHELQVMYERRAEAELAAADELVPGSESVASGGSVFARNFLVKGSPGPEDARERRALAGADGEAARRALEALGCDAGSVFATVARVSESQASREAIVERLALQIEAVDPATVVALDGEAADLLAAVAGVEGLPFGEPAVWKGRTLLAVDGLEASLTDEDRKRRVWEQFRSIGGR